MRSRKRPGTAAIRPRRDRGARSSGTGLGVVAREYRYLLAAVGAYAAFVLGAAFLFGYPYRTPFAIWTANSLKGHLVMALLLVPALKVCLFHLRLLGDRRGSAPSSSDGYVARWNEFSRREWSVRRLLEALLACVLVSLFLPLFSAVKSMIPDLVPFAWDRAFMALDAGLHLGRHPWRLLQPVLGRPWLTNLIDGIYYVWFPLFTLMVAWHAWNPDRRERARFLSGFVLCWILIGTLMAYLFSSAGPCYYAEVVGEPDPYTGLMAYLHRVHETEFLRAVLIQDYLWDGYTGGPVFGGISAMPSMHVALPAFYSAWGFSRSRGLGLAFALYTLVTLLGSVHLGWHYAVDGYLAAAAAVGIWWWTGRLFPAEQPGGE